jgi:small subunit ribosomal protein S4
VNGVKVTKPSYQLRPGDIITVRNRENLLTYYRSIAEEGESMEWLTFDNDTLRATVNGLPGPSDISLPVNGNQVVEFMSR